LPILTVQTEEKAFASLSFKYQISQTYFCLPWFMLFILHVHDAIASHLPRCIQRSPKQASTGWFSEQPAVLIPGRSGNPSLDFYENSAIENKK